MDAQAVAVYRDSLSELNSLSKVEINALTMLADDNKEFALQIAACIEKHLKSVSSEQKLPILYLIDSICKNYPQSKYVQLFTQNIVSNFCHVFEVSKEKTRRLLHKLRITWSKTNTFPPKKLHAIDVKVHEMDPNWPIIPKTVINNSQPETQPQQQQHTSQHDQTRTGGTKRPRNTPQQQQQRSQNEQLKTGGAKRLRSRPQAQQLPTAPIPAPASIPFQQIAPTPAPFQQLTATLAPFQQPPSPNPYPTITPFGYPTPDGLFQEITPILLPQPQTQLVLPQPQQPTPPLSQQTLSQQPAQQTNPPPLFNDLDSITLNSLYGGKQCSNCSLRFDDSNKYAIHLDWHYRQNLKSDNVFARRKWYYPLNLWVQFREINDDDVQENVSSDNNNANDLLLSHQNDHEVPTAPASKEDENNICSVCHETFEKFWAQEEEEWRLKNARLHDDQKVYHPLCLMDMLQASKAQ